MSVIVVPPKPPGPLPDHTQLPETDGTFVTNFDEHPQSILLTDSIGPTLEQRHPDGQYAIGQDCGIYWEWTDPPLEGVKAPDWFYVPHVPPRIDGQTRRSYVLWYEHIAPLIILEFASEDGSEELNRTPREGKFWVYEQAVHAAYYGVYIMAEGRMEMYRLVDGGFERMEPNEREHYPITPLGVELGLWQGRYQNFEGLWLRWWDKDGNMLLTGAERAEQERQQKEQAQRQLEQTQQQAESERQHKEEAQRQLEQTQQQADQERRHKEEAQRRAERLAEQLRALGVEPDQ